MDRNILFVGLDVDDRAFHAHLISEANGDTFQFSCKPTANALIEKLKRFTAGGQELRMCYEASYLGNSLCRSLRSAGFHCDVIAPSLVPREVGQQVKTDRLDARKLSLYLMKGLLTPIRIPDLEDEVDRDLVRSRSFLVAQLKAIRNHILSICRRSSWDFKNETGYKHHWTKVHTTWLLRRIKAEKNDRLKFSLNSLVLQMQQTKGLIESYDEQIELMSKEKKYKQKSQALLCYRGVDTLVAMTLVTEIGDIHRFKHPKQLTSFIGLDIKEYSSGGKDRRFGITKLGNKYLRTALVEANQFAPRPPAISRRLVVRREGAPPALVEIADRAMKRLHKKSNRMIYAGKNYNKVKVACARESIGFIWESLREAA